MKYFAGIDVSMEQSSLCVLDAGGEVVTESTVATTPEAIAEVPPHLLCDSEWSNAGLFGRR